MDAFITRQPNGLLCRYSSVVDGITHYNMTDEEYLDFCAERARKEGQDTLTHGLKSFEYLKDRYFSDSSKAEAIFEEMQCAASPQEIKKKRAYLSGPVRKDPSYKDHFSTAEQAIKKQKPEWDIINPTKISNYPLTDEEFMQIDLALLSMCDRIVMLPGWEGSTGANRELKQAIANGQKVYMIESLKNDEVTFFSLSEVKQSLCLSLQVSLLYNSNTIPHD